MSVAAAADRPGTAATAARFSPQWIAGRLSGVVLHLAVIGLTVAWMVPTIGILFTSFRPFTAINSSGWWLALSPPFQFTLDNYSKVLSTSNLGHSFFNSFMISIPATIIPVAIAAFAAYAFAWMKFPFRDWIFLAIVGVLAIPLQLSFVPVLSFFVAHGITPSRMSARRKGPTRSMRKSAAARAPCSGRKSESRLRLRRSTASMRLVVSALRMRS